MLAKTVIGARICVTLLDDMLRLFEAEEESEAGKAFNVGYAIFTRLIEQGVAPDLYKKFTMCACSFLRNSLKDADTVPLLGKTKLSHRTKLPCSNS